ncbi:MAG: class I SAM-dependent methyltransferase [Anaerolineae bacterium]|nr:class I SAM-dependent methyltransferase [Anaerolineae bacterium]
MNVFDNLIEYADAAQYDEENSTFEPDGPFFVDLIRQYGQPVLELACGTGRLTIPIAQQGFSITGLDVVSGMLSLAKHKAADLPIEWIEADARRFHLGKQFKVILAGGFFQHLLERADQEAVLAHVRAHLAPDGVFAFNVFFPHADSLEASDVEQEWFSYVNPQGQTVTVSGTDHYDSIRQVRTETAMRRWTEVNGQRHELIAPLQQRLFFPQELEALLHYNGFTILERYGDYDRQPLAEEHRLMIFVCQARR